MVEVRIPATSANMGPGFDCLGIALNMYNCFTMEETHGGLCITGCKEDFRNENNLVYTSMIKSFSKVGYTPKGISIKIHSEIPSSRGLGSSASCILGGILGANELAGGMLSKDEILQLASEIEGHPDNITPALLGGMTISIKEKDKIYYDKINLPQNLKFCALIPDFALSTKEARSILPASLSYRDSVFNIGRACLMVTALTNGNLSLIKEACNDRLHQIYRGKLIENYDEIIKKCSELNCIGVFLSGAGPTIMVILQNEDKSFYENISNYLGSLNKKWTVKELKPDFNGAVINNITHCEFEGSEVLWKK